MKKIIFNITAGMMILSNVHAQKKEAMVIGTADITVPFNHSISILDYSATEWSIISSNPSVPATSGKGLLNDFKFERPGRYKVHIDNTQVNHDHDGECKHEESTRDVVVSVSSYELDFDFNSISFSDKIKEGSNTLTISVNAILSSFDNTEVDFSNADVKSAGVGTTISGKLISGGKLKPGVNKLSFQLSGEAVRGSYIMFDFKDINGAIQSYSYSEMVK